MVILAKTPNGVCLVRVVLLGGALVKGMVQNVDPNTQKLTLTNATLATGDYTKHYPTFFINGSDINDLKLIQNVIPKPTLISNPPIAHMSRTKSQQQTIYSESETDNSHFFVDQKSKKTSTNSSRQAHSYQPLIPDSSNSKFTFQQTQQISKSKHQQKKQNSNLKKNQNDNKSSAKSTGSSWAQSDVSDYSHEFDFQSNLKSFDKTKVFEEIKRDDSVLPEHLLVNLNRNSKQSFPPVQKKIGIREMVLEPPTTDEETGNDAEGESSNLDEEDDEASTIDVPSSTMSNSSSLHHRNNNNTKPSKRSYFESSLKIPVPCLTSLELDIMERISVTKTGPNPDQQIENAARCTAQLVLQALGGSQRFKPNNHNAPPIIVVLAGESRAGAYGIAAARQLANHDCNVIVCWVGGVLGDGVQSIEGQNISPQLEILPSSGAKLVNSASDLPNFVTHPVDLIVDGLLGGRKAIQSISSEGGRKYKLIEAIRWAIASSAPKLSLEAPSGSIPSTDSSSSLFISPKYTICFGLPLERVYGFENSGEVFLADVGVPKALVGMIEKDAEREKMEKIRYLMPFGDKFLVGLFKK